jgi:hypothetical protein
MRKALTMLGATAALALGSFFAAPVQAFEVECYAAPSSQSIYPTDSPNYPSVPLPTHMKYCVNLVTGVGASMNDGGTVGLTIRDMNGSIGPGKAAYEKLRTSPLPSTSGLSALLPAVGKAFFVFANQADYLKYFRERGYTVQAEPPDVWAVTSFMLSGPDKEATNYVAMWLVNDAGQPINFLFSRQWVADHEAGHVLNYEFRSLAQPTNSATLLFSDSALYFDIVQHDIGNFNDKYDACSTVHGPGVFTGRVDQFGKYICASSGSGSIGGNPAVGNTITIKITDPELPLANGLPELPQNHFVVVTYTLGTHDSNLNRVASGIVDWINGNSQYQSLGITADSDHATVTIGIGTGSANTEFDVSTTGSITMNFQPTAGHGNGTDLSKDYAASLTNTVILFKIFGLNYSDTDEFWSNQVAYVLGQDTFGDSQFAYYENFFPCSAEVTHRVVNEGRLPTQKEIKAIALEGTNGTSARCIFRNRDHGWELPK